MHGERPQFEYLRQNSRREQTTSIYIIFSCWIFQKARIEYGGKRSGWLRRNLQKVVITSQKFLLLLSRRDLKITRVPWMSTNLFFYRSLRDYCLPSCSFCVTIEGIKTILRTSPNFMYNSCVRCLLSMTLRKGREERIKRKCSKANLFVPEIIPACGTAWAYRPKPAVWGGVGA